jgi:hypothetical protein
MVVWENYRLEIELENAYVLKLFALVIFNRISIPFWISFIMPQNDEFTCVDGDVNEKDC